MYHPGAYGFFVPTVPSQICYPAPPPPPSAPVNQPVPMTTRWGQPIKAMPNGMSNAVSGTAEGYSGTPETKFETRIE